MHRTTDPACSKHRPPSTALGLRHHDRNRGRSCPTCMPGKPTPRHRIRMEVLVDAEGRWYGWYCTRCSECSMLKRNPFRAWWASIYYRRHGICRAQLIVKITPDLRKFRRTDAAAEIPAAPAGRFMVRYRGFSIRPFIRLKPIMIGTTRLYTWGPIALFLGPSRAGSRG